MIRGMTGIGGEPRQKSRLSAWVILGMISLGGNVAIAQGPVPPPFPIPPQQGPEQGDPNGNNYQVLTRGPIHEAFAESVAFNPMPGPIVPKAPPAPVEELPPDQKPEGGDVEWIPGYWAWDDERNDYIWISGIWRDIPPGRQWVPGYWMQAENGFQWTSGFWASDGSEELTYLPIAPPPSLENGPNSPVPGENFAWTPGSWAWQENRYVWRPGYWIQTQPDWIWIPSRYVPTPSGYLYVDSYWDYPIDRRGMNFAPVYFTPTVLAQPNYSYTPTIAFAAGGLLANLFVRPNHHQYYFGDYYSSAGRGPGSGYVPWYGLQQNRQGYDPLYSQMSVINARREPEWDRRLREDYRYRYEHQDARPAHTFLAERARVEQRRSRGEDVRGLDFARPLNQWNQGANPGNRLVAVDQAHRAEINRRQGEFQKFRESRLRQESASRPPADRRAEDRLPQQIRIPRSPIVAGQGERRNQGPNPRASAAPPARPEQHNLFRPALQPGKPGPRPDRPDVAEDRKPNRPDSPRDERPNRPDGKPGMPNRPDGKPGMPNRPGGGRPQGAGSQGPGRGAIENQPHPRPVPQPQPQPQPKPQPRPQPIPQPQPAVGNPVPGGPRPGGDGKPHPKRDGNARPKGEGGNRPNGGNDARPGGGPRAGGNPQFHPNPQPTIPQQAGGLQRSNDGQPGNRPRQGENEDRPGQRKNPRQNDGATRMMQGGSRNMNQPPHAGPRPTPTSDFRPKPQQPHPDAAANAPRFQPRPVAGPKPQGPKNQPEPKAKSKAEGKAAKKKADR